jgi:hypothetical protein
MASGDAGEGLREHALQRTQSDQRDERTPFPNILYAFDLNQPGNRTR